MVRWVGVCVRWFLFIFSVSCGCVVFFFVMSFCVFMSSFVSLWRLIGVLCLLLFILWIGVLVVFLCV